MTSWKAEALAADNTISMLRDELTAERNEKHNSLYRERCRRETVENDNRRLRDLMRQVFADATAQDVLFEWWPMMEEALKTPNGPHEGPARASCAGPLDAVVGPQGQEGK